MANYFVSDIHIQKEVDSRGMAFLHFLSDLQSKGCQRLFLVGDIFDLWIGKHKYFLREYKNIVEKIDGLVQSGVEVHYFEGNHDLYLKYFWQEKLGVMVHSEELLIDLDGKKFRIEHGDLANPEDKGYLFLRRFLRSQPMDLFANNMPGKLIHWLGETASSASRTYTNKLDHNKKEVIRKYAHKLASIEEYDFLITGHFHVLDDYVFDRNGKEYRSINLGSWLDTPKAFLFSNHIWQQIEL